MPLRKPKTLIDIQFKNENVFQTLNLRVNLSYRRSWFGDWKRPLWTFLKGSVFLVVAWIMFLGTTAAPTGETLAATSQEEKEQLQAELQKLETEIEQYENQITGYRKQGNTLSGEIGKLNTKISKLNAQIRSIQLTLSELNSKIGETQTKIGVLEGSVISNKEALGKLLRNLNEVESTSVVELFLRSADFSEFVDDVNGLTTLQDNLRTTIQEITALRDQLKGEKERLILARADAATIKNVQESQRKETEQVKREKNTLLTITKGQESKYQQIVSDRKARAAQIQSRIFQLLGGGQMTFEQAYQFAKFASNATGVRVALLLAVLDRESAMGRNVGRCTYHTAMNPTRDVPAFMRITNALGIDPEKQMVSCPNSDGVYGGAMGPAQFIPSTWEIYADKISAITGKNPVNPWSNSDSFVASALYLRDSGAATNERIAAAKYYCGGRWNRYVCTQVYGRKVVERAAQFEDDIKLITGN